jgi:hypothetical protein
MAGSVARRSAIHYALSSHVYVLGIINENQDHLHLCHGQINRGELLKHGQDIRLFLLGHRKVVRENGFNGTRGHGGLPGMKSLSKLKFSRNYLIAGLPGGLFVCHLGPMENLLAKCKNREYRLYMVRREKISGQHATSENSTYSK